MGGVSRSGTVAQRDQAAAAREQAETTRLDRRRNLDGWNVMGVNTYGATLVTDPAELAQAVTELTSGQPTAYAVLRVTGSTDSGNANLALSLRQLIQAEGYISRPPPPENAKPVAEKGHRDDGEENVRGEKAFREI